MLSRNILTLTLTFPLLYAGCTADNVALEEVTETPIGATGGQALSAGGELTLGFQAGTLASSSVVRIQTDRSATKATYVSPIFDLEVTPAVTTFDPPVQVDLQLATGLSNVSLVHLAEAGAKAVEGTAYDSASGVLQAQLTHFSSYVAEVGHTTTSTNCPAQEPAISACPLEGQRCEYGQECCCGQCYPSLVYVCRGGSWGAAYTDACLIPACPDAGTSPCPAEAPTGACTTEGDRCEYGQECCCGQCYPSVVSVCQGGSWATMATDACFNPECPDAG